ncbi:rod-binding protein [Novosphingobium album (ex Liu et al. 2023)]|uniref:Rod-binding protein n=1 Tax=Novosphingobium album (ex Liu et al. 2023) TaxID=3031130 RepID=A0ABT5WM72_9SPHN|nr:rod-binding protein [Novosphingobium album (ex Liu et al. 2023)]MDE8651145.1 rod-binding protein [Novosphingobium album (ex Liu et al. 2023)]
MTTVAASPQGLSLTPQKTSDRAKLAEVAKQFEAIFMRQMLAAARKTDFGGDDLFGGQAMETFRQMQDEHFADLTAKSGSLGLAAKIEAQLARFLPPESASGATASGKEG